MTKTFTKIIGTETYTCRITFRDGKKMSPSFTRRTDKGEKAVAWNSTVIISKLNRAFAAEINAA
jgi:hypothetical protein